MSLYPRTLSEKMSVADSHRFVLSRLKKYNGKNNIVQFVTNHVVKKGAWYDAAWNDTALIEQRRIGGRAALCKCILVPQRRTSNTYILFLKGSHVESCRVVGHQDGIIIWVRSYRSLQVQVFDAMGGPHPRRSHAYCHPNSKINLEEEAWATQMRYFIGLLRPSCQIG